MLMVTIAIDVAVNDIIVQTKWTIVGSVNQHFHGLDSSHKIFQSVRIAVSQLNRQCLIGRKVHPTERMKKGAALLHANFCGDGEARVDGRAVSVRLGKVGGFSTVQWEMEVVVTDPVA